MEIIVLVFVILVLVWVVYSTVIGGSMGAPFVVTPDNILQKALKNANLKPGENFWDLGCGDGRVIKRAMNKYKVIGWGAEINPLLVLVCKIKGIKISWSNLLKVNFNNADVIYMYIGSEMVNNIAMKLEREHHKKVRVISRRFEIKTWKSKLISRMPDGNNWVYFYQLN